MPVELHARVLYSLQRKAIGQIETGQVMEVLSADEGTRRDIPKWCTKKGFEYLGTIEESGFYKIFLRK